MTLKIPVMMMTPHLNMRNEHGQFAMNIGATSILDQSYLDDDDSQDSSDDDDTSQDNSDDDFDPIELDNDTNEVLLDNFMASTTQAKHLSKIWRISHEDAQRTIDVTTQMSTQTDDPTLSRNYSTNDRMLRYKRIKDLLFFPWIPSLQPRKVANHHEAILVVNLLSLIKDSYMLFQ